MKISLASIALLAAIFAVLAPPAAAAPNAHNRSTVTIDAYPKGFFGQVKSPREGCTRGRSVTLFRALKGRSDRKVGRSHLNRQGSHGVWSIQARSDGRFYVRVAPKNRCHKDISPTTESMPRGALDDVPNCPISREGFCEFERMHLDIPWGTYCPPFSIEEGDCTGYVTEGLIPWCCNEDDRIRWDPIPRKGTWRLIRLTSHRYRGDQSFRWKLTGFLYGPGDGALKNVQSQLAGSDVEAGTPDASGAAAGTMGGPLHFDFRNGNRGADVYVDGYLLNW